MSKKNEEVSMVIATKREALWMKVKEEAQALIKQSEDSLEIQQELLKLAEQKIKDEQEKSDKSE